MLATLAACGGDKALAVAEPSPPPSEAIRAICQNMARALPEKLDDLARRPVSPATPFVAAWGDPAVVLRCGVPRPGSLTTTSDLLAVNEVGWFAEQAPGRRVFTAVDRVAEVEVSIPVEHDPAVGPLVDLAPAITTADPKRSKLF